MSRGEVQDVIDLMGSAARINRLIAAAYFIQNPKKIKELLDLVFDTSYKLHYKAAWVLEFVLKDHITWILPHLTAFTSGLAKLQNESAIRPVAKICQWIAFNYVHKENQLFINKLTKKHLDLIIEASFDWMIGEYKVASKVYTMYGLYYFGQLPNKDLKWIHVELKNVILQHINTGTPAFKSAGKRILSKLD